MIKPKYRVHYLPEIGWVIQTRKFLFWYKWDILGDGNAFSDPCESEQEAKDKLNDYLAIWARPSPFRLMS